MAEFVLALRSPAGTRIHIVALSWGAVTPGSLVGGTLWTPKRGDHAGITTFGSPGRRAPRRPAAPRRASAAWRALTMIVQPLVTDEAEAAGLKITQRLVEYGV